MLRLGASALLLSLTLGCAGSTETADPAAGTPAGAPAAASGPVGTELVLSVPDMH